MGMAGDGLEEGVELQLGTGRGGENGRRGGPWGGGPREGAGPRGGGEGPEEGAGSWGRTGILCGPRGGTGIGWRALEEGREEGEEAGGGSIGEVPMGETGGRKAWFRILQTLAPPTALLPLLLKTGGVGVPCLRFTDEAAELLEGGVLVGGRRP